MKNDIILTPVQVLNLKEELLKSKADLELAREQMESYKETERFTSCYGDESLSTIDDSYYQRIASLVTRIEEIETLLDNYILANPKGDTVQIGSIVELADRDLQFMVIQKKVTYGYNEPIKEVSIDSPIFGAIYMHKVGDVCEYAVNGKAFKCVIGKIDNDSNNVLTRKLFEESKDEKVKVK